MYALAVLKLQDPDSQSTPFACAMIPTIDSTGKKSTSADGAESLYKRLTWSHDDILQNRPLHGVHEIGFCRPIPPTTELRMKGNKGVSPTAGATT